MSGKSPAGPPPMDIEYRGGGGRQMQTFTPLPEQERVRKGANYSRRSAYQIKARNHTL